MSTAKRDMAFQIPVETRLRDWLALRWNGLVLPKKDGKDSHKDAVIYRRTAVEMKCDYKAEETGNLFFEVFNCYRKEASGLTITKADIWVHYVPSKMLCFIYRPKQMLAALESKFQHCKLTGCGDANSDGYIVPMDEIRGLKFVQVETTPML